MNVLKRAFLSEYLVLWLCVIYVAALGPFTPDFLTSGNFENILSSMLPLFLVAMGQTIVLIVGGIDLSVTSIIALTSVVGAMTMTSNLLGAPSSVQPESATHVALAGGMLATPAAIIVMLSLGSGVGALNGLAITKFRMPPFIVTLTGMMFFSGLAIWLTSSQAIGNLPHSFTMLGNSLWIACSITVVVAVAFHLMLSQSLIGRWLYAIGHNPKASFISGVPVHRIVITAYALSGLCAAMGAILITGQTETGAPNHGERILLDIIGATVIGGTSLFGGKGKIVWTLFGVLFLKLIDNSLNLLNLSDFCITMVKGSVILFAALMDALRNKWSGGAS